MTEGCDVMELRIGSRSAFLSNARLAELAVCFKRRKP